MNPYPTTLGHLGHWLIFVAIFAACCVRTTWGIDTGADPGRNLTRAQQNDRGRGYMGVATSQNYEQKRASSSDFYYWLEIRYSRLQ